MDLLFNIALIIHITGGTLALLGAPVALLTAKGKKAHRVSGNIFFAGMTFVFITAIYMSIAHLIPFLFMVGIFSYQMVITGRRTLRYKTRLDRTLISLPDRLILFISFLSDLVLVVFGAYILHIQSNYMGLVGIAFGLIGLQLVYTSYRRLYGKKFDKSAWLFEHIGNMIGGYIAAITAFLVVNIETQSPVLLWLAPTVAGSGLITYFISYYKRKLEKAISLDAVVTVRPRENKVSNIHAVMLK